MDVFLSPVLHAVFVSVSVAIVGSFLASRLDAFHERHLARALRLEPEINVGYRFIRPYVHGRLVSNSAGVVYDIRPDGMVLLRLHDDCLLLFTASQFADHVTVVWQSRNGRKVNK